MYSVKERTVETPTTYSKKRGIYVKYEVLDITFLYYTRLK